METTDLKTQIKQYYRNRAALINADNRISDAAAIARLNVIEKHERADLELIRRFNNLQNRFACL